MSISNRAPSKRQFKIAELIRKAVVEVFLHGKIYNVELSDISITVSEVRVTPDLKTAIVYVVPLEKKFDQSTFITMLREQEKNIRFEVTKIINLKFSPKLIFKFDDSFDRAEKLEKIFEEIRQQPKSDDACL